MIHVGSPSPWGKVQHRTLLADGIVSISTAGHGGIHLSEERNAKVHPTWRRASGWYEEDCEWAIVGVTFPEAFRPEVRPMAHETARNWFPDEYEEAVGVVVRPEESYARREQLFERAHVTDYVVRSAWGDWHEDVPTGMVGCYAVRADDKSIGYFLVPAPEYKTRDRFGFIIDPARHAVWPNHPE